MTTVTLSNDNQLVIPKEICDTIPVKKGVSFEVISYDNRIELVPLSSMKHLKGIFRGIDTTIVRDDDRL
jgi:bifunctional DNA-binding transcriptional regulator/antitoxin component of YhaV-PrlF toxin-antitoxin module